MYKIGLFIISIMASVVAGCSNERDSEIEIPETVETFISLAVNDFNYPDGTRASTSDNYDESRIHNALVFQFDAITGNLLKNSDLVQPEADDGTNNFQVGFINDKESIIAIIANVGSDEWIYDDYTQKLLKQEFKNYNTFLELSLPTDKVGYLDSNSIDVTGIPMFGVSKKILITNKTFVMVPMERLFARVHVNVDFNAVSAVENDFKITDLIYRNIPGYCRLTSLSTSDDVPGLYPEGINWNEFDAGPISEFVLYIPGNLQGKVIDMVDKQSAAPEKIPEHALAIDLTIQYKKDDMSKTHTYTVYPGLDKINDFNIKRNLIYDVNIKLTHLPE